MVKDRSKEGNEELSEDSLKILSYLQNKAKNIEERPKGSLVSSKSCKGNMTQKTIKGKPSQTNIAEASNPFAYFTASSLNKAHCNTTSELNSTKSSNEMPSLFQKDNSNNKKQGTNPLLSGPSTASGTDLNAPKTFDISKVDNPFIFPGKENKFNFSFNFDNPFVNKAFEEEDEEEEAADGINPEEEVPIDSNEEGLKFPKVQIKSETDKFYSKKVKEFFVYDFDKKKYVSKGKGTISIETYQNTVNQTLNAMFVFRNEGGMNILYRGNILSDLTSIDKSNKPFSNIVFVSKAGKW